MKCPHCGKELTHVSVYERCETTWLVKQVKEHTITLEYPQVQWSEIEDDSPILCDCGGDVSILKDEYEFEFD